MRKFLKYFLSLVILLHCLGATQLLSAYSKDRSAFVGMLSMNEEETKKEKESKEDVDCSIDFRSRITSVISPVGLAGVHIYFCGAKNRINHQFVIELPTPPPDSLV